VAAFFGGLLGKLNPFKAVGKVGGLAKKGVGAVVGVGKKGVRAVGRGFKKVGRGAKSFSENDVRVSVDLRRRLGVLGSNVLGSNVLGSGVLGSGVLESGVLESGLGALLPKPPFNLKMVKLR
jgi:hypothetical protein